MVQIPRELAEAHLRTSCKKGDVLYWEFFEGHEQDKNSYFVLLTSCINGRFLAVRGTKRVELYTTQNAKRVSHDTLLIKSGETAIFPKDTILDFTWMRWLTLSELAKLLGAGVSQKGTLPANIIGRIDTVVEGAITISSRYKALILKDEQNPDEDAARVSS